MTQRAAVEVADECLQIHGGYGYMREYGIERAVRDLRLGPIGGGTDEVMKEILGQAGSGCRTTAPPERRRRSGGRRFASLTLIGGVDRLDHARRNGRVPGTSCDAGEAVRPHVVELVVRSPTPFVPGSGALQRREDADRLAGVAQEAAARVARDAGRDG